MNIKFCYCLHQIVVLLALLSAPCRAATVTFSIDMANVLNEQGQNIATTALFQMVGLGTDGIFNPITPGSWVGGDDVVVNEPFSNADGWTTASAFDLTDGVGTPGEFTRQFTFTLNANLFSGEKIGVRWFPTIMAANFGLSSTVAGTLYGQFTRQSSPLYGGSLWVVPTGSSLVSFDPMITPSYDAGIGQDSNATGLASSQVVPEPGSAALIVGGLICSGLCYRSRSKRA